MRRLLRYLILRLGGVNPFFRARSLSALRLASLYGGRMPTQLFGTMYYDMYVAEFEYDGIEYQIVAEQMEAEEVVKVVSSIIYGEEVIVDK